MGTVKSHISMSLDGFVAGPNQTKKEPLGEGGEGLHEWAFATESWHRQQGRDQGERNADSEVIDEVVENVGAYIMGRGMFAGQGEWDPSWKGWWGDEPPYHVPVFVLTHHEREPLAMEGGTTFSFVNDGIESALDQARSAAGDRDVAIAGGANAINQYLAAGLLDELYLHIVPVLLGGGARLLENAGDPKLEPVKVVASPGVTHVKYGVVGVSNPEGGHAQRRGRDSLAGHEDPESDVDERTEREHAGDHRQARDQAVHLVAAGEPSGHAAEYSVLRRSGEAVRGEPVTRRREGGAVGVWCGCCGGHC